MPILAPPLSLPPLTDQAERLIHLGVHHLAGVAAADVRRAAATTEQSGALLVLRDARPSALAPLLERHGRPGFVVADMGDVDDVAPVEGLDLPRTATYGAHDLDRGDGLLGRTPTETYPLVAAAGRSPLTLTEGLHLLLQRPELLEPNHCFMTTGSRPRRPDGSLDARTPALWISRGTGRDGKERRGAPKVGWCWAGNHHTWLGIASAGSRAGA